MGNYWVPYVNLSAKRSLYICNVIHAFIIPFVYTSVNKKLVQYYSGL